MAAGGGLLNFTPRELGSIIRTCRDCGVAEIEIPGLKLNFRTEDKIQQIDDYRNHEPLPLAEEWEEDKPEELDPDNVKNIREEMEKDPMLDELRLQNLMIEDPLGYEQEMERRKIENA